LKKRNKKLLLFEEAIMARHTAPKETPQLIWKRRSRASLMRGTALQAAALAVLATPAAAQLAPNARPSGGQVSAGQAAISDTASKTLITQSSQNASINWQSYNVGSAQTVQYKQPNAQSMTLNRVVGADPSIIAGHILANGQIVLVNQSGVVFAKGAQVDTAGLVVSTAGITDKNFMSGKLVFDQAGHVGAAISNAGNITIRQAGLAALVAPQVANSGTITAKLGRVILGGAETHTLDLYGDGLVSLNVTGQVTKASLGGQPVTALVTNSGTILAPGGTVVLSAAAADGVVTNLVEAGGRIAAPSLGTKTGRVLVQGIGGGISIDGDVSATGLASGTKGGQVVANATGAVRVGAGATIDASGDVGGGVIAIGTTAARALGGASVTPTLVAQSVTLASGAHVRANATRRGTGGRIAVLSRTATTQSGDISARGGAAGGDGGWIEVSGGKVGFGGLLDVGATTGKTGAILIDPADLQLGGINPDNRTTTYISAATFLTFTGDVILKADGDLTVAGAVSTPLNLQLGGPVVATLQLEGDLGIAINAPLNAPGTSVALKTNGAITEGTGGIITAASLSASAGGPITLGSANKISDITNFDNTNATTLTGVVTTLNADSNASTRAPTSADAISVAGLTAAGDITLVDAASLTLDSASTTSVNGTPTTIPAGTVTATGGSVAITVTGITLTQNGNVFVTTPDTLSVGADVTGENVTLATTGTVPTGFTGTAFSQTAGTILAAGIASRTAPVAGTISIETAMGALSIGSALSTVPSPSTSDGSNEKGAVTLTALAGNIVEVSGSDGTPAGSIFTGTLTGNAKTTGTGNLPGDANFAIANGNTISTLTGFTTAGNFDLEDDSRLVIQALASAGTIGITNSSTGSVSAILAIDGPVSAGGNLSLANTHGIAELANGAITSATGAITLDSGGGIVQQTLSSLTSSLSSATALVLTSRGFTDFASALGTAALGTVTGMSLGGTITAGTLSGAAYTGGAVLVAYDGSIVQPSGSLRANTLFGSAANSDSLTTPQRDLALSVSSGNTISTILELTATGSLAVEDDVALSVDQLSAGASISVFGPAAAVAAPGVLTLNGSITAAGGISLQNTIGIAALGSAVIDSIAGGVAMTSGGAIFVQQGAAITGAQSTGSAISLSAAGSTVFTGAIAGTVHGISLNGVLTAGTLSTSTTPTGYTGTMSLTAAAGDIVEGADGSLFAGTLTGHASGSASFTSAASSAATPTTFGNTITTIGSFSTGDNFALLDQSGLTVQTLASGGNITITAPTSPSDVLLLAGTISSGGIALFSNPLGVVELTGAKVTDSSGAVTLFSAGGAIVQEAGSTLTAGGVALQAGGQSTFDSGLGIGTVIGVAVDGHIDAGSTFLSATAGDINEGGTATLASTALTAQASGTLQLAPAFGNAIGTLSGYAHGGDVSVENDSALSIGNLSASGGLSVLAPSAQGTQTGSLTIFGTVTATDDVSLANTKGIAELSGGAISSATGTVTLRTAGAISQQANSTISGGTTSGTGTLVALSAGNGISLNGSVTAGTLSGSLRSGIIDLTASAGNIIEGGTGSLGAITLAGGAAAGSASFTSTVGNAIGTLSNFAVTGNFALEDNAGLLVRGQTAGGSIDIHGPTDGSTPGGFLVLDGNITAPGNITLSNALGVVDLAPTNIHSISGGVTLASAGGAVFEQSGAAIDSGATTGTLNAISLQAGGHSTFGTPQLNTNFGTIYGVEIDGTVTAGSLSAAGIYTGSTFLSATHGNITEGAQADVLTGSLTAQAASGGVTASLPLGNVSLVGTSTNLIAEIGNSSATGSVVVVDAGGLILDALHAGSTISVQDPAAGSSGILIIRGAVSAVGSVDLANALGIADLATGSVASADAAVSLASSDGAILQQAGGTIVGGTAAGTGTLVTLSAGGTTNFGTYGVTAPAGPVSGISFGGTLAAGQIAGGLYSGTVAFAVTGGTIAEADTGSLRAAVLTGSVAGTGAVPGDASFLTTAANGNLVGTLSAFTVSGSFSLEDDAGLTVLGQSAGGSIVIKGPSAGTQTGLLVIDGTITAPGDITLDNGAGILDLAGGNVTSTAAGVSITSAHGAFAQQAGATISAGGTPGIDITADGSSSFTPSSGFTSLSGITFNGTLDAGATGVATLVTTGGNINEGRAASLRAGTLNGSTSGNANLDFAGGTSTTGSNVIASIGSFSSAGDTDLRDNSALTIGTLTAGGNVAIQAGSLTLAGVLSGAGGTVALSSDAGISLGGTLTAGSLSGSVYSGLATLSAGGGAIVQNGTGSLRAGTLSGSGASASFDGGNTISLLTRFTAAGNFAFDDSAGLTLGTLTAGGRIGVIGTGPDFLRIAGPVSAVGNITLTTTAGIAEIAGATVQSTGGSIALIASDGGILQQGSAALSGAAGLSLEAGGSTDFGALGAVDGIAFAGRLIAGTLSGTSYTGSANLLAGNGNIVEQTTGVLQAGTLLATAQTSRASIAGSILLASTSSLADGNRVAALGASSAAAGFGFVDGQAVQVTGLVQAGGTTAANLQIVAPAIDVTSGRLTLLAPTGAGPGVINLVADHFEFLTPGAVSTPGGLVALDLLNSGTSGTTFSLGGTTISGSSLSNIQSSQGTLTIGQALDAAGTLTNTPNTGTGSWTLGAVGTVTAIDFAQPVDFGTAASPAALGLFSLDSITVSNGITVGSLYGSAGSPTAATGSASFLGSNAIGTLGVVNDAGALVGFLTQRAGAAGPALQFQLTDTTPLLVLGPVSAGQGAVSIGVSGAGNALTIGSTAIPLSGQISGTDVALAATGPILQSAGTITAFGAATGTNGTIALASSGGAVTLDGVVQGGSIAGSVFTPNAQSALLLDAGGGDISEGAGATLTAGTLAALASGNIVLGGTANSFATIGSLTSVADGITLYGLAASGASGITLQNTKSLLIADDSLVAGTPHATVSAMGTDSTGAGSGSVTISLAAGTLSLGSADGATVEAAASISLSAPGAIVQTGGAILADGGDARLTAPLGVVQSGARIQAARDVVIESSFGSFAQTSSTVVGDHGVSIDTLYAISSTGGGTIASVGIAGDTTSGTVSLYGQDGAITFDGTIAGGYDSGIALYTPRAASAVLLYAGNGGITQGAASSLEAGTLGAFASGDISLGSTLNHVANIGSLSSPASQTATFSLLGLTADGPTGILFVDDASLNILGDTPSVVPGGMTGPVVFAFASGAGITIDEVMAVSGLGGTSYGTFSIGAFGASTVKADGRITLQSTGTLSQGAGTIMSASGSINLVSSNGDVTQTGGSVQAGNGDVSVSALGTIAQSAATLTAGGNVVLQAGGGMTLDASQIGAGGNITARAGTGDIDESGNGSLSAGGDVALFSAQGGFNQTGSSIFGSHGVALSFGGTITSLQSVIVSQGIAGDATSGTVSIAAGGDMLIDSQITAGPLGAVLLSATGDINQISAGATRTGSISTPALAAAAGGNLNLDGANQVQAIAALSSLAGLYAGSGNIDFVNTVDLTLAPGASVSALNGSIAFTQFGSGPPGLLSNGATILAGGDISLAIGGALTQSGGLIQSKGGDVIADAAAFTQSAGGTVLAFGNVSVTATSGAISQSADSRLSAGQTLSLQSAGDVTLAGTLEGGTLTPDLYHGAIAISTDGAIIASTATLLTGTLAASAGAAINLDGANNVISQIGTVGSLIGLTGAAITLQDAFALTVAGNVSGDGAVTFTLPTAAFTELPGVSITAIGPLTVSAGGDMLLGGTLSGAATSLSAAGALTEQAGADISAATARLSAGTALTIDGTVATAGNLALSAGTDLSEGAGAVIETNLAGTTPAPLTLTAPGTITLDGLLEVAGPLTVIGGAVIEDSSGVLTADASITSTIGAVTLDGALTASGPLTVTAFGDLSIGQTGTLVAGATTLTSTVGSATIAGDLTANGTLTLNAGEAFTLASTGLLTAGDTSISTLTGPISIGGVLTANGTLGLTALNDFTLAQGGIIAAGPTTIIATGTATIDGLLIADGVLAVTTGSDITLGQFGRINAGDTAMNAALGTLGIDGALQANGSLALTAGTDVTLARTGSMAGGDTSITAGAGVAHAGTVTIDGQLTASGTLAVTAATDVDLAQTGSIAAVGASSITAVSDNVTIDGTLGAQGKLSLRAANSVSIGAGGTVSGSNLAIAATNGSVSIVGDVVSSNGFAITAGTDVTEAAGASIAGDPAPVIAQGLRHASLAAFGQGGTITAGDSITIGGLLSDPRALTLLAGNAVTVAAGAAVTGGITSLTASTGAVMIDGQLTVSGSLQITAGTDILADAAINALGPVTLTATNGDITGNAAFTAGGNLALTAGGNVSFGPGATVTAGPTTLFAGGAVSIDGPLTAFGALQIVAGTDLLADATLNATGTTVLSAGGAIAINAGLTSGGALTLGAGADIGFGTAAVVTAPSIALSTPGSTTIAGSLTTPGTLSITGGDVTIDGAVSSPGAVTIVAASDFSLGAAASLSGGPLSVTAKSGSATIDGAFTSTGAFTLDAGTNITQGDTSTIADTRFTTQGLSSAIAAPGTITLGGTLSVSSLLIGDFPAGSPVTKSIVWNNTVVHTGSNATIHGATSSISIAAPLLPGKGALGVYTQSSSFQQTGTASVSAIPGNGSAATLQIGIEGRGAAKFASLIAPDAQLLLVLEQGGSSGGLIDVAGLNVFYTQGVVPIPPVVLHGTVGGRGGFAAAAVGFSHHLANVAYQINGCPIESINCILLSPLLVPIVDPVNDYAEGTQRKRHQDDDALPNVGEEDY
jgi:filamentous hemagglutinin family protein